eukprot:279310-Prorocentrum_minimum.AAC.1
MRLEYGANKIFILVRGIPILVPSPCDWLPRREYALFPPVIGSRRGQGRAGPSADTSRGCSRPE